MPQTPCLYCGQPHDASDVGRCDNCNGLFEPLSQIATQLAMGPWYVRDEDRPFMPGFNEAILRQQVAAGRITANTIMRGPTTNQFWMNAADVPGVSRLMGTCHSCHQAVEPTDSACQFCKSDLSLPGEVDALGLRYTTDELRAQAQQEMAQQQSAKPAPKPSSQPAAAPQPVEPKQSQPVTPVREEAAPDEPGDAHPYEEDHDEAQSLHDDLAEDVWQAGATSSPRRRKRQKGADPLVLGMGVVLLCVVALGGMIILTSGGNDESDAQDEQVDEPVAERSSVDVSRVSVPALTVFERLSPEDIPEAFEEQYAAIRRLKLRAEADEAAERYDLAYDTYKEMSELVTPLENEVAQWQANEEAKAEVSEQRDRVATLQQKAQAAEGPRWAAKDWQAAQTAWDEADRLFTASQFVQASDQLAMAEAAYLAAEEQAKAGQAASDARTALIDAMKASASEQTLRQFAQAQVDDLLRFRTEGNQHLNDQQYAQAEQSYNKALGALREAEQVIELAKYKKYYAFDAGYRASAMMLAAARGDGVQAPAQSELAKVFDTLRITPNPATGIKPGDEFDVTAAVQPLINDARDAIIAQHGQAVQACYLIGFHASIIDQTLQTKALTDDQQKRIHQSLGTIEAEAVKAGWDIIKLRPIIDQVRITNRKAKIKSDPEPTRTAWKRLLTPMQSRSTAPRLMDPILSPGDADDPELFPGNDP